MWNWSCVFPSVFVPKVGYSLKPCWPTKCGWKRCTLTVSGSAADGSKSAQDVSFSGRQSRPATRRRARCPTQRLSTTLSALSFATASFVETPRCFRAMPCIQCRCNGKTACWQPTSHWWIFGGTDQALPSTTQVQINLQHVTARMRRGMCRMTTREDERFLPLVRINCTDCILMTDGAPLIDQRGDEPAEEQQKRYCGKGTATSMKGSRFFGSSTDHAPPGRRSSIGPLGAITGALVAKRPSEARRCAFARLPDPRSPKANQSPWDYMLDESEQYNPALGSATDGTADVGMKAELLPASRELASRKSPAKAAASESSREPVREESPPPRTVPELSPTEPAEE